MANELNQIRRGFEPVPEPTVPISGRETIVRDAIRALSDAPPWQWTMNCIPANTRQGKATGNASWHNIKTRITAQSPHNHLLAPIRLNSPTPRGPERRGSAT
jgi:hypothetical protein